MRGGTGRLPGRDDARDPGHVYVSVVFIAYCLYGGGTFFVPSRLSWDLGFSNRDPSLSGTIFAI